MSVSEVISGENLVYKKKLGRLTEKMNLLKDTPYKDIGIKVEDMTPRQFKKSYKGPFNSLFKYVKNDHNRYLGIKTVSKLLKLQNLAKVYGIIYKISLIKDKDGNKISNEPSIIYNEIKKVHEGFVRTGRCIELKNRINTYQQNARDLKRNYPFEDSVRKYGWRAFKLEILAVCISKNEYIASEYFWTLFYNKKSNQEGYDLSINNRFNLMVGSKFEKVQKYNVPKYLLTKDILLGFERSELEILWEKIPLGILKLRLKQYFGTSDLYKIRLKLAAPYIDKYLKRGLTQENAIKYLIECGFEMFCEEKLQERIEFFKQIFVRRSRPEKLLYRMINDLYKPPSRKDTKFSISLYEQLRLNLFIVPYTNYLKEIGVKDFLPKEDPMNYYDFTTKRFREMNVEDASKLILEFSIVEYLISQDASNLEIAFSLGWWSLSDDVKTRIRNSAVIDSYLQKYKNRISLIKGLDYNEITFDDVRAFIKSHNLGLFGYNNYLISKKL